MHDAPVREALRVSRALRAARPCTFPSLSTHFSATMCKHILNAQVSIRAPCCRKFFDCPQCHAESSAKEDGHQLRPTTELAMLCKKCRRAFRVDLERAEEADNYCPHCDNCYVSGQAGSGERERRKERG